MQAFVRCTFLFVTCVWTVAPGIKNYKHYHTPNCVNDFSLVLRTIISGVTTLELALPGNNFFYKGLLIWRHIKSALQTIRKINYCSSSISGRQSAAAPIIPALFSNVAG